MQDEVVIRQPRSSLIALIVGFLVGFIGLTIKGFQEGRNGDEWSAMGTFLGGSVFFVLLLHFSKKLYERNAEMAISYQGIYLRNLGLYPWSLIESFSTVEDTSSDSTTKKLVLHFENYADEDFDITNLEYEKEEIIDLMLAYKGSSTVYYAGHKIK